MVADLAYKTPIGELRMFVLNYYFISGPDDSNTYNLSSLPRRHASMVNKSKPQYGSSNCPLSQSFRSNKPPYCYPI